MFDFLIVLDQQSTQLVEKLLQDLLQTTEGYQKLKNQLALQRHDEGLNQQALIPLQKENERLVKENNGLHGDIIAVREEKEANELRWKNIARQTNDEMRDTKFLAEAKDAKIRQQEQELVKIKTKLQSTLEKIYMPSADKVVDGLSKFDGEAGNNVLQGHEQAVDVVGGLANRGDGPIQAMPARDQEARAEERAQWAAEVRRADERCDMLTQANQEMQARFAHEQAICKGLVEKIKVRDEEILRLHSLYLPAQNLEKLNLKHVTQESERAVKKLEGQVDFLNQENEKLQRQVDLLKVDETGSLALAQVDALRKDLADANALVDKVRKDREDAQRNYRDTLVNLEELEVQ